MSKYEVDASWQTLHDQAYETVQDYMTRAAAYVDKKFGEYTDNQKLDLIRCLVDNANRQLNTTVALVSAQEYGGCKTKYRRLG